MVVSPAAVCEFVSALWDPLLPFTFILHSAYAGEIQRHVCNTCISIIKFQIIMNNIIEAGLNQYPPKIVKILILVLYSFAL